MEIRLFFLQKYKHVRICHPVILEIKILWDFFLLDLMTVLNS